MSSTRSNAAHAVTSTVSELYCLKDCTPSERRKKVAALLKGDALTCPDGFRSVCTPFHFETTLTVLPSSPRGIASLLSSFLRPYMENIGRVRGKWDISLIGGSET